MSLLWQEYVQFLVACSVKRGLADGQICGTNKQTLQYIYDRRSTLLIGTISEDERISLLLHLTNNLFSTLTYIIENCPIYLK